MFQRPQKHFRLISCFAILPFSILIFSGVARAQQTGGDLGGGAGIFRPKNPEAKRNTPSKPVANKPTRPTPIRPDPAETEEKFEEALADGNDARDALWRVSDTL